MKTTNDSRVNLRILIADEDHDALKHLAQVLTDLGHEVLPFAVSVSEAMKLVAKHDPEATIVMIHDDSDHALDLIAQTVTYAPGPVIAYTPESDGQFVAQAAERGVTAYTTSSDPDELQSALEIAWRQHSDKEQLESEVAHLKTALDRRILIERAKGIVMERHSISEKEAFERLRAHARANNRRVFDVAAAVCDSHALLPKEPRQKLRTSSSASDE